MCLSRPVTHQIKLKSCTVSPPLTFHFDTQVVSTTRTNTETSALGDDLFGDSLSPNLWFFEWMLLVVLRMDVLGGGNRVAGPRQVTGSVFPHQLEHRIASRVRRDDT